MENKSEWTFERVKAMNNGNANDAHKAISRLRLQKRILYASTKFGIEIKPNCDDFEESEFIWKE